MSDAEPHSVPETDLLKDLAWAEKTFATSPLGKMKVRKLKSLVPCFFFAQIIHWWAVLKLKIFHIHAVSVLVEKCDLTAWAIWRTAWVHTNLSLHAQVLYCRSVGVAREWRKEGRHKGMFFLGITLSMLNVLSLLCVGEGEFWVICLLELCQPHFLSSQNLQ